MEQGGWWGAASRGGVEVSLPRDQWGIAEGPRRPLCALSSLKVLMPLLQYCTRQTLGNACPSISTLLR